MQCHIETFFINLRKFLIETEIFVYLHKHDMNTFAYTSQFQQQQQPLVSSLTLICR